VAEEIALAPNETTASEEEKGIFVASQWQLMWWKFRKHHLAIVATVVIAILYVLAIFCEFFAPYDLLQRRSDYIYAPPQRLHFFDGRRIHLRPFVYGFEKTKDPETLRETYVENKAEIYPIQFFTHGSAYKLWGMFASDIHFAGVEGKGTLFLLGTDRMGRDVLSRVLYGARISLSIGLIGVALSLIMGLILGGVSGYYGGVLDTIIQRVIELLRSFPSIPLWMALSAALPPHWPALRIYFGITVILSLIGWTGLARVVRGKILALREEDFTLAAQLAGAGEMRIITRHLLPSFMSHIIVSVTLAIPGMILSETALSFLGLGLRAPITSWGVLLQEAQNARTIALQPWLMLPALFVIITVLGFNFIGDGLRDAADPYGR
jgi:peptide/nickel transport system permease protein